jgi:hypothetical protein
MISMANPSMRKTMPSGRNAELPDLSAGLFGSDVGFLSPFIYDTLREYSQGASRISVLNDLPRQAPKVYSARGPLFRRPDARVDQRWSS